MLLITQYPIIRNGLIRNSAEFLGKFKKRALGKSNLRNAAEDLRNGRPFLFRVDFSEEIPDMSTTSSTTLFLFRQKTKGYK